MQDALVETRIHLGMSIIVLALLSSGCGVTSDPEEGAIYAAYLDQGVVKKWREWRGVGPQLVVIDANALEAKRDFLETRS